MSGDVTATATLKLEGEDSGATKMLQVSEEYLKRLETQVYKTSAAERKYSAEGLKWKQDFARRTEEASKAIDSLNARTIRLASTFTQLVPATGSFGSALIGVASTADLVQETARQMGVNFEGLAQRLATVDKNFSLMGGAVQGLGANLATLVPGGMAVAATFVAMKNVAEPMLQTLNDITGVAKHLNTEFQGLTPVLDKLQKASDIAGRPVTNLAEATRILFDNVHEGQLAWESFTNTVATSEKALEAQRKSIDVLAARMKDMTDSQLLEFGKRVDALAQAEIAAEGATSEHTASLQKQVEILQSNTAGLGQWIAALDKVTPLQEELTNLEKEYRDAVEKAGEASASGAANVQELVDKAFDLQIQMGNVKRAINEELARPAQAAAPMVDKLSTAVEGLASSGEKIASLDLSISDKFGMDPELGRWIETETKKNLDAQAAAWKKYDEEIKQHHDQSVDAMAQYMIDKFGEANVIWSNQFNQATEGLIGSMSKYWKAGAESLGSSSSATQNAGTNTARGRAQASVSGIENMASLEEQLNFLDAKINERRTQYEALRRELMMGRYANTEQLRLRGGEIDELERMKRELLGQKSTVGDRLSDRFADMNKPKSRWEKDLERIAKATEETSQEAKKTSRFVGDTRDGQMALIKSQSQQAEHTKALTAQQQMMIALQEKTARNTGKLADAMDIPSDFGTMNGGWRVNGTLGGSPRSGGGMRPR